MGRPAFKPNAEQIELVVGWVHARVPIETMAARIGIMPKTFRKHFARELGLVPMDMVDAIAESTRPTMAPAIAPAAGAYRPSTEQREAVKIMAGARFSHAEIARKACCTVDMLREHFADELERGPVIYKSDIITSLFYAAKGGNVAAAKVCLLFNGQGEPEGDGTGDDAQEVNPPMPEGLQGKKANATLEAQNAEKGTPFDGLLN